jgi:hypothetical protein
MASLLRLGLLAILIHTSVSYLHFSALKDDRPDYIPHVPVPRPWQLPPDVEMTYEELPSMITAIAPSTTMASNGTVETLYSMHYHDYFVRRNEGKGVFKRGVFASDPPIATCTPCGFQGTILPANATMGNTSPTASCTLYTYLVGGVFLRIGNCADRPLGRFPFVGWSGACGPI